MRKHIHYILGLVAVLTATASFSQDRTKDTINTGVIDVVKPYTPTISDAFKVKEIPSSDDEETVNKKEIKYNIFSFPVASTFTPAKGKAALVEKRKPEILFDNYATLGVGSYTTLLGEVYLNHALNRTENVGGYVSYHTSQGDVEDVLLDDNFSVGKVNLNYAKNLRNLSWNVEAGFEQQKYNWYGLPTQLVPSVIDETIVNGLQVDHSFYNAYFGGDIAFKNTFINSGSILFRRFGDNQDSGENRFIAKTNIDIPISGELVKTTFKFDYLSGSFDRSYFLNEELKYGNFQIGLSPTYQIKEDDLTLNLGFSAYYLNDKETDKSKFYIYPNITASYRLVNDILIAYGGIEGDLIQNSYHGFANENPFVSPTLGSGKTQNDLPLGITPTDQQYNAYIGLKGKLSNNMSYNVSGHYKAELNKALFVNNNIISDTEQDYSYGNSFGIVYDDLDTFGIAGEINVDVNRNFKLGIKAEYFTYTSDDEAEAWNLPDVKGSVFMDYQINEHWFMGANLFYIGERKDQFFLNDIMFPTTPQTEVLDSYFDANAHLGYHINDQFSVFAKANNIANNAYQRWQNYQVQSIQFLAGLMYKFDF